MTNPGDPMADPEVVPEPIYGFNQGRALIWSTGVAGVTNEISADVRFDDNTIVEGDRDLTISGDIYEGILDRDAEDAYVEGGGQTEAIRRRCLVDEQPPVGRRHAVYHGQYHLGHSGLGSVNGSAIRTDPSCINNDRRYPRCHRIRRCRTFRIRCNGWVTSTSAVRSSATATFTWVRPRAI